MTTEPAYEVKFKHQGKVHYAFFENDSELSCSGIVKAFRSACSEHDYSDHTLEFDDGSGDWITLTDDKRLHGILKQAAKKSENGRRICVRTLEMKCDGNGCVATNVNSVTAAAVRVLDGLQKLNYMQLQLTHLRTVLFVSKPSDHEVPGKAREMIQFLIQHDLTVHIGEDLIDHEDFEVQKLRDSDDRFKTNLKTWNTEFTERHAKDIDLVITLGGDGTVLYASGLFQTHVPPVMSVFMGSLGFLTNVKLEEFKSIMQRILKGEGLRVTLRNRLHCSFYPQARDCTKVHKSITKPTRTGIVHIGSPGPEHDGPLCKPGAKMLSREVMNELVLDRGPHSGLIMLDLFADGLHLTTIQADGLIIATPTGSTAYSLSCGGSLVHPDKASMLITPICAHTLTCRPMILPFTIELKISVSEGSRTSAWASFDGRDRTELKPTDAIRITASRYPFLSLCRVNPTEDWCQSLISTLHWNEREKQKPFS
ncbi:hypothetical protein HDV00_005104 [Rhizophlyctis rosea]|nr:hypothetical protein HDV00_005104 [Rhizophlyctis rosea]